MLRSVKDLRDYKVHATDGDIGGVDDLLFDDEQWTVRYMVLNTGGWLTGRLVLVSPLAVRNVRWEDSHIDVGLTREQIERSPDIAADQPVSRQMEQEYASYYGYSPYWGGPGIWGAAMYPGYLGHASSVALGMHPMPPIPRGRGGREQEHQGDQHLRSAHEVTNYRIQATDDEIGHVQDFVIDDETWSIRYMVVDTRNWWPGKKVLVSPRWIADIDWASSTVTVELTRDEVKRSPEYDPDAMLNREYEAQLHQHYGRPGYWEG